MLQELKRLTFFHELPESELNDLARVLIRRQVKKGSYIMHTSEPGDSVMFVSEGKVRVTLSGEDGREVVLAILGPGGFFGEIALLTGRDRSADVAALTDATLFVLTRRDFENHIKRHSGFVLVLGRELALRLRAASAKIGDLVFLDVYCRVARALKSVAKEEQRAGDKVFVIDTRPTHQELAAMVGTSREMVTRALKKLEDDECIVSEGKKIFLYSLPF